MPLARICAGGSPNPSGARAVPTAIQLPTVGRAGEPSDEHEWRRVGGAAIVANTTIGVLPSDEHRAMFPPRAK